MGLDCAIINIAQEIGLLLPLRGVFAQSFPNPFTEGEQNDRRESAEGRLQSMPDSRSGNCGIHCADDALRILSAAEHPEGVAAISLLKHVTI